MGHLLGAQAPCNVVGFFLTLLGVPDVEAGGGGKSLVKEGHLGALVTVITFFSGDALTAWDRCKALVT